MGEEMNQQLFYAPIWSDGELRPLGCATDFKVDDFPAPETNHEWGLSSFSLSFNARIKRLRLFKLPRKVKKRFKKQLSRRIGIPTKELRVLTGWKNRNIKVEFEDESV